MRLEVFGNAGIRGRKGSMQTWVEEGYAIFSLEGPSSIQVERVARSLGKNKSGFYYFFKDRERFVDCLMSEHLGRLNSITRQIREIQYFDPEYIHLLIEHREAFLFQIQLLRNREVGLFENISDQFSAKISAAVIPVWSDYLDASIEVANRLWSMTREAISSRATKDSFTFGWLLDVVSEAKLIASCQSSQTVAC